MKILGIIGSPKKQGNTFTMVSWIMDAIKAEGIEIEIISLNDFKIEYCTGCTRCFVQGDCPIKDEVALIHKKMSEADGLIFGAPAYALNVPAQTKVFIDRSSFVCHRPQFIGKFSAVVSCSGGGVGEDKVCDYLEKILYAMGYTNKGRLTTIAYGRGRFHEKEKVIEKAKELGVELIGSIKDNKLREGIIKDYVPMEEVQDIMKRVGPYLKADYEFWKQKGWV